MFLHQLKYLSLNQLVFEWYKITSILKSTLELNIWAFMLQFACFFFLLTANLLNILHPYLLLYVAITLHCYTCHDKTNLQYVLIPSNVLPVAAGTPLSVQLSLTTRYHIACRQHYLTTGGTSWAACDTHTEKCIVTTTTPYSLFLEDSELNSSWKPRPVSRHIPLSAAFHLSLSSVLSFQSKPRACLLFALTQCADNMPGSHTDHFNIHKSVSVSWFPLFSVSVLLVTQLTKTYFQLCKHQIWGFC